MAGLLAGIEAGGTKFVCGLGSTTDSPPVLLAQAVFPTTHPDETLQGVVEFLQQGITRNGSLAAIGVAAFGPVDPEPHSPTFGYLTSTPKPGWSNFNLVGTLNKEFDVPIGFDTDVNGAALGEWRWGAAQGLDTFLYLTIGTGIGGGGMVKGQLMHGLVHPEMGHIYLPHDRQKDPFDGWCPYHGDCFEGLAAGPALEHRWGQRAENFTEDHPAWELEAHYIALALANFVCILSPQRIILGGGVMQQAHLFPRIRSQVQNLLNGYVQSPQILKAIDYYIVSPGLGSKAGLFGAMALAEKAAGL